jgi:DNA-binding NarL/FixJ family response regulator
MNLTPRELEVLEGLLAGKHHKQIAEDLHVSLSSVKHYSSSIYEKHGVSGRYELLRMKQAGGSSLEWDKLDPIDKRISRLYVEHPRKEIARIIGFSESTLGVHLCVIYAVLRVRGRGGLIAYMAHHGVLYGEPARIQ